MEDSKLTLDEVVRRFADSEEALVRVRGRLEGLADAETRATRASDQLQEASVAVSEFANAAGAAVQELQRAQRESQSLLEAGSKLLQGNDLAELKQSIETLRTAFENRFEKVEDRLATVDEVQAQNRALEDELAHIKQHVPGRALKKAMDSYSNGGASR